MNKMRSVETDRFEAVAEDGNVYEIVEMTRQTSFTSTTKEERWADGPKEYRAIGAGFVNQISDTEFELLDREIKVRRK
jgi:hypothetical protein